jgi:acyl-coenzyme A thioesterase PaaI-like protein
VRLGADAGTAPDAEPATVVAASHAASQQRLDEMRARLHANCVACGTRDDQAAQLRFRATADGGVEARVAASTAYEGYAGMVHGGVIATLLDAAMTNCLFAQGRCAVTADLHLRYRHPVASRGRCLLKAWVERSSAPLFVLRAELWQAGQLRVTATGKFMEQRAHVYHDPLGIVGCGRRLGRRAGRPVGKGAEQ